MIAAFSCKRGSPTDGRPEFASAARCSLAAAFSSRQNADFAAKLGISLMGFASVFH
jgi:hypothetical protein